MSTLRPPTATGKYDLTADVWGNQVVSLPKSLFHGLWTYDVPPNVWLKFHGTTETNDNTAIYSEEGQLVVKATAAIPDARLESRECPRYQPNRGQKVSESVILPNPNARAIREFGLGTFQNGAFFRLTGTGTSHKLEIIRLSGGVEKEAKEIDLAAHNIDLSKGNVTDLRFMWRGVGDYETFINLKMQSVLDLLGKLTELSIENPAMPAFFRSRRIEDDATLICGCVDITSENGADDYEEYGSTYAEGVSVSTDTPVVIFHNPMLIGTKINTRTISLAELDLNCNKKATFKFWVTRDPTAIIGATFTEIGYGSHVQTDSPDINPSAVRATSIDTSKMRLVRPIIVEAARPRIIRNPSPTKIRFPIVRGDYGIITCTSNSAIADAVAVWGEQI
jgi:hypothetical protein